MVNQDQNLSADKVSLIQRIYQNFKKRLDFIRQERDKKINTIVSQQDQDKIEKVIKEIKDIK